MLFLTIIDFLQRISFLTLEILLMMLERIRSVTVPPYKTSSRLQFDNLRTTQHFIQDRSVSWLQQSGMDYLLIPDFHSLSTSPNAVWKLTFSNGPSTPLPCCPSSWSSDDQPGWQGAWPWHHHRRWTDHGRTCRKRCPQLFLPASTTTQRPAIPDNRRPAHAGQRLHSQSSWLL